MKLIRLSKPYRLRDYDFKLLFMVVILSVTGILVVGSAREDLQSKQLVGVIIGVIVMLIVSFIDYVWIQNFYWLIYIFAIANLALVLLFGVERNNARRWIDLKILTYQPSELVKILLILFCATYIMKHQEDINNKFTIIKYAVLCGIPLILIYKQPNLTTTICTGLVLVLMYYLGGLSYKIIGVFFAVFLTVSVLLISVIVNAGKPIPAVGYEYQQERILAFFYPEEYKNDEAYQQLNSEMAIGSGQLTGKGLNNNTTTSLKNGNFILEPQTDFIFAIVGEELGFIGSVIVIALLLLIVLNCISVGARAQDISGQIICCGVGGLIGIQGFINMGVAMNMIPNTGVPLPFVSNGLTSLVSLFLGIGLVLNVSLQPKKY